MVTLLQSGRVGRSTTERPRSQRSSGSGDEHRLDSGAQLADGNGAFELLLDSTVAPDEERPWLALKIPLPHPAVVALEHLNVDEADAAAGELLADVRDDVDDRATRPTRAELRRGEGDHERLV